MPVCIAVFDSLPLYRQGVLATLGAAGAPVLTSLVATGTPLASHHAASRAPPISSIESRP